MDGKTVRGVRENGEQLRLLHLFSREGSVALDQVEIAHHHEEPRAAERWIRMVSSRFEGLEVLSGRCALRQYEPCRSYRGRGQGLRHQAQKKPTRAPRGYAQFAFSEPREPDLRSTTKGHGRLEQRAVWVSSELAGYSTSPGLSNVIKVSKRVKHLKRGEWVESEQYAVTSLSDIDPKTGALPGAGALGDREQIVRCQG